MLSDVVVNELGLRAIRESEISLAVLFISCSHYCNPDPQVANLISASRPESSDSTTKRSQIKPSPSALVVPSIPKSATQTQLSFAKKQNTSQSQSIGPSITESRLSKKRAAEILDFPMKELANSSAKPVKSSRISIKKDSKRPGSSTKGFWSRMVITSEGNGISQNESSHSSTNEAQINLDHMDHMEPCI